MSEYRPNPDEILKGITKAEHKTNQPYWFAKIERNRTRDRLVNRKLATAGWKVLRFWEREILDDLDLCVTKVMALIQQP